eukprot:4901287-Prymnesium_polylepis.1
MARGNARRGARGSAAGVRSAARHRSFPVLHNMFGRGKILCSAEVLDHVRAAGVLEPVAAGWRSAEAEADHRVGEAHPSPFPIGGLGGGVCGKELPLRQAVKE